MKTSLFLRRAFAVFTGCLLACTASAQVYINEVCADNEAGFDNDGDFPDYVELFNTSAAAVNIAGWRLMITNYSDPINDPNNLYIFPANTVVPGGGFLVVICDGESTRPLHTKFSISKDGAHMFLLNPAGTQIRDAVRFGFQVTDRPFGRVPDGTNGVHVLCLPTPGEPNIQVPLGIRNRIRFNEWMPSAATDPDWFEIYNPETNPIALSGVVFSTNNILIPSTNKAVVTNSWLAAGGFLKIKADSKPATGNDEWDFKMPAARGHLLIFAPNRGTIWHHIFWPDPTGMQGHTNNAGEYISYGWLPDGNTNDGVVTFPLNRDTPGDSNFLPIDNVLINEVLAHTDPPLEDAIELYNPTGTNVNISGWWLSDDKDVYNKFRIPNNTIIPPYGYVVFYEYREVPGGPGFNPSGTGVFPHFALSSSEGDQVYLFATYPGTAKLNGFRRGVDFPASQNGVSYGRYITSTGESDFIPLERLTFGRDLQPGDTVADFREGTGATNAGPKIGPLVVNEIMYHPPDIFSGTNVFDNLLDEYIEIYNISTATVYLYDTNVYPPPFHNARTNTWRIRGEVGFEFPTNVSLGPGRSLVVVSFGLTNTVAFRSFTNKYNVHGGVQIFGAYRGRLSNGGGNVEIERPDAPQQDITQQNYGFVPYLRVDRVRYNDEAPWPIQPDGYRIIPSSPQSIGYTLARKKPERYGGDVTNWMAAVPSVGRQVISNTVSCVGDVVTISFEGLAGSGYTVQYRDALEGGGWIELQDVLPQTTSGPRQVVVSAASPTKRFYRVVTPMQ